MAEKYTVEIPEWALLTLAAYGKMGDGEVPKLMQAWAKAECTRLGLQEKMQAEQERIYQELKRRAANVWGESMVERVELTGKVAGVILAKIGNLSTSG